MDTLPPYIQRITDPVEQKYQARLLVLKMVMLYKRFANHVELCTFLGYANRTPYQLTTDGREFTRDAAILIRDSLPPGFCPAGLFNADI